MNQPQYQDLLFEPYSIRERGAPTSLYSLDPIPPGLRAQIVHILRRLVGEPIIDANRPKLKGVRHTIQLWGEIAEQVAESLGRVSIVGAHQNPGEAVFDLVVHSKTLEVLDTVETIFHICRDWGQSPLALENAVASRLERAGVELNQRFRQHHMAYRIQGDQIIRVDSQYLHREVTEKAFTLLDVEGFEGALEEFRLAHRHFLDDELRQSIGASHSAFESTLKTICDRFGWKYDRERDGAKRLIDIVLRERELVPSLLQPSFRKYLEALELGLPVLGNRKGRHGQGSLPDSPNDYIASYALNLTATNIVLLIEAYQHQHLRAQDADASS